MGYSLPSSSVHAVLQTRVLEQPFPSPGDIPNPGIKPRSPTLQEDSSPSKPPGKHKNTRVGSLSLLQGISPTQEFKLGSLALQEDSLPTELPELSIMNPLSGKIILQEKVENKDIFQIKKKIR